MNSNSQNSAVRSNQFVPCSLIRRCASMIYDFILMSCILFIAWLPMPFISEYLNPVFDRLIRSIYLLAVCFIYFAWPWCKGGQTLGMRSWQIRLINSKHPDRKITLKQAWLRFAGSIFSWVALGAGFLISHFHPRKLAWHDLFSGTSIIRLTSDLQPACLNEPQHNND